MHTAFSHRLTIFLACFAIGLLSGCFDQNSNNMSGRGSTAVGVATNSGGNLADSGNLPSDNLNDDEFSDWDSDNSDSSSASDPITPQELTLSWRPSTGLIDGYMIFHGPDPESATALLSITLETTVHLDPVFDLGLKSGDFACFRIKAYNSAGTSDFSDAVCFTYNA